MNIIYFLLNYPKGKLQANEKTIYKNVRQIYEIFLIKKGFCFIFFIYFGKLGGFEELVYTHKKAKKDKHIAYPFCSYF